MYSPVYDYTYTQRDRKREGEQEIKRELHVHLTGGVKFLNLKHLNELVLEDDECSNICS